MAQPAALPNKPHEASTRGFGRIRATRSKPLPPVVEAEDAVAQALKARPAALALTTGPTSSSAFLPSTGGEPVFIPKTAAQREETVRALAEPFQQAPEHAAQALRDMLNTQRGSNSRILTRGDVEDGLASDDLTKVALATVVEKHFYRWARLLEQLDSKSR